MAYTTKNIKNILLILILLFINSYCSINNSPRKLPESFGPPNKDNKFEEEPKDPKKEEMEEKLKTEYEEKLKENILLKQEIDNKIRYITILSVTGGIMLLLIIFIVIKICINRKKEENKSIQIDQNNELMKNNYNVKARKKISKNNNNILNLDSSNNNLKNNSELKDNSLFNNSELNEDNGKNLDAPKIDIFNDEKLNDDNKTLTNNPDVFLPSKTDKILYRPYSDEEIYQNKNNK